MAGGGGPFCVTERDREKAKHHRCQHGQMPTKNHTKAARSHSQAQSYAKPRASDPQLKRCNTSPALYRQDNTGTGTFHHLYHAYTTTAEGRASAKGVSNQLCPLR
jgi:hypothetical protein